jgi:FixJ family two-component response regulator
MGEAGEPPLVVVVDDNAALREALEGLLRSAGFAVRCFEAAEAFLGAADAQRADCLVLDSRLPGMSGQALQRLLRAGGSRFPVIFVSAHAAAEEMVRARALQDGALAFLRKPFRDADLLNALRSALGRRGRAVPVPATKRGRLRRQT